MRPLVKSNSDEAITRKSRFDQTHSTKNSPTCSPNNTTITDVDSWDICSSRLAQLTVVWERVSMGMSRSEEENTGAG